MKRTVRITCFRLLSGTSRQQKARHEAKRQRGADNADVSEPGEGITQENPAEARVSSKYTDGTHNMFPGQAGK